MTDSHQHTVISKNMNDNRVHGVADPIYAQDAVNLRTLNRALANAGLPTLEVEDE